MKKIYKSDLGSRLFIGSGVLLFAFFDALSFFAFGGAPLEIKVITVLLTLFFIYLFLCISKYQVVINDSSISTKILIISFIEKYLTINFDEIGKVYNAIGPFPDMQMIIFKSNINRKNNVSILVGFGLPWQALLDILEHLPKNVEINFEPLLWKRIKNPPKPDTPRRVITAAIILILLILAGFCYSWWNVFIRR
jgi:hypothetical protein